MDIAYDHILESSIPDEQGESGSGENKPESSLNADLQEAYRTFSASPWGARIGGFFGSVVKQGESVYREAQQELSAVGQDATRGFTDLRQSIIKHTRNLSLNTSAPPADAEASSSNPSSSADPTAPKDATSGDSNAETTPTATKDLSSEAALQEESETVLSRLRGEAAKRLKDLQRAEDAADEALLRFGSNLRDFFRDAIQIAPPTGGNADNQAGGAGGSGNQAGGAVLFESKDAQGKRVIHTSRFDAQLHVIHTSPESFVKDGNGAEFEAWQKEFDVEKKTDDIAGDLDKYPELRATMEKLVPDQVAYADFWKRYYFLRHGIETAEARRRDLLKAASAQEEVGWDEDSEEEEEDDDEEAESEPDAAAAPKRPGSAGSSRTIQPPPAAAASKEALKPAEPRKSNDEKSQADSEASYDVVGATSGVPSQAPSSPKESRKADDESDEEDEEEDDDEDEDDDEEEDDSEEEDWE